MGIGAGKPTALKTTPVYPNVLYYCTNDLATLNCGVSLDGGLSYGPSHPVFTDPNETCSPIIGHIKSAPDGTTYVMSDGCSDEAGDQAPEGSPDVEQEAVIASPDPQSLIRSVGVKLEPGSMDGAGQGVPS